MESALGHTSNWVDWSFYREISEAYGEPVLDAGCSTGRLLLDYMEQPITAAADVTLFFLWSVNDRYCNDYCTYQPLRLCYEEV